MHKLIYNSIAVSLGIPFLHLLARRTRIFNIIPSRIRLLVKEHAVHALLVVLVVAATVLVSIGAKNALVPSGSHDFMWTPASDLAAGNNPYQSFMEWKDAGNKHTPPHFLNQSPSYPASVILLFTPFAALEWSAVKITWLAANLLFIGLLLWGLQRTFPIANTTLLAIVILLFLCSTPLRASLGAGQHNFLSLAAFVWAYHFCRSDTRHSQTISGILLSIAWVKYSLTFPLTLLFLARGQWKPVAIASSIHAVLTGLAAWKMGLWPQEFFFSSVEVVLMGDGIGFLNLVALSMSLQLPLTAALIAIAIASIYALWLLPRHDEADDLLLLNFLGLFSCAVFYHHGYDFIILLLCAWALARQCITGRQAVVCGFLVALAWCGQWLAHELVPYLGTTGARLADSTDYLLVGVFYTALVMLWSCLRRRQSAVVVASQIGMQF